MVEINDPGLDPYFRITDPVADPGGPKTYGFYGSDPDPYHDATAKKRSIFFSFLVLVVVACRFIFCTSFMDFSNLGLLG
jgi:hypothetical protein